jgi:hypothetical protein
VIDPIHQPVTVRARAGADVPLYFDIPAAESDRRLTSAKFIVGVPGSTSDLVRLPDATSGTVLKEKNQVTSVALHDLAMPNRSVVTLRVPDGTPAGDYPIFAHSEFPSPSVCGLRNDPNSAQRGQMLGQVGTLTVVSE